MKNKVEKFIEKLYVYNARRSSRNVIKSNCLNKKLESLTKKEANDISIIWSKLNLSVDYSFFTLCKNLVGFDARYISEDLYNPIIKAALNPAMQSVVFENKCLYDKFFPDVKRPKTICKNIMDEYYNEKDEYITIDQAIKLILANDSLVIKPGVYSDSGNSVKKFTPKDSNQIQNLFNKYSKNFIIQEVITQSDSTSIFNPESVNTLRISSLFLNGKVSILSPVFRCGQKGGFVDNTGAGGIIVGLSKNGHLNDYGFDLSMNKHYESSNGVQFKGKIIKGYEDTLKIIKETHKNFPTAHLIGWDFAIDENNNPTMIEVNIAFPGIIFEQLCSGPFFGDRTDEVIEYVLRNKPSLRIRM